MSCKLEYLSKDEQQTILLAQKISGCLNKGDILCLFGDLGSGKTTFVKGLAKGLKVKDEPVSSPTFVLMNSYQGRLPIYHFDLYRLNDSAAILNIGIEEFFYGDGVAVIEWAERLKELMPKEFLSITLEHRSLQERLILIGSSGKRFESVIEKISADIKKI